MHDRHAFIARWAREAALTPLDVDCAVTLMLKIIDGKCKMDAADRAAMEVIYDQLGGRSGERLDPGLHELIARTRHGADAHERLEVYEQRLLAETTLSRPVMKAYKAMLRQAGVL